MNNVKFELHKLGIDNVSISKQDSRYIVENERGECIVVTEDNAKLYFQFIWKGKQSRWAFNDFALLELLCAAFHTDIWHIQEYLA